MITEDSTTKLNNILNRLPEDKLDEYLEEHTAGERTSSVFADFMLSKSIRPGALYLKCSGLLSKSYVSDLVNGKKLHPSRDVVIILAISMGMDRKLTRRVLSSYGFNDLSQKDKRDAVVAAAINNKISDPEKVNEMLESRNLEPLHSSA